MIIIFILIDLDITSTPLGAPLDNTLVPKALASSIDITEYFILERKGKNLYLTVQSKPLQVSSSDLCFSFP